MAKMNLEFLLSPDKDNGNNGNNNNSGNNNSNRQGRNNEGRSSRGGDASPFSLDYIAPRASEGERNRPSSSSSFRHLGRRPGESSSSHSRSAQPAQGSSSSSSAKPSSSKDQPSPRSNFKTKKTSKTPSSSALRSPASVDAKPHVCPSCDRSFYKLEQLKRHDRLVHLNLRPFVCTTCDLSFGTKQNMQVHLTTRKHQHRLETIQASHRAPHGSSSRQHP